MVDFVVPDMGLQNPSAPLVISLTPPLGTPCSVNGCENTPLYLSGSGRASQETAISDSCQQALLGIHIVSGFGDCIWDDHQVEQFLDGLSFSLCSTLCLPNSSHEYFVPPSKKD